MKDTSQRGGPRPGAGRPRKRSFWYTIKIGQECEILFCMAKKDRLAEEMRKLLSEKSNLAQELSRAQAVEVDDRSTWTKQEDGGDQYVWDFQGELEQINVRRKNANLENRLFSLPARPRRGTRNTIIKRIAAKYSIPENEVDNLWQAYRRFEKSIKI